MSLEDKLLKPVELIQLNDVESPTDIEQVHLNHQVLLENDLTTNNNVQKLVSIMGGMDNIFEHCLSIDNPLELNKIQLRQINKMFISIHRTSKLNLHPAHKGTMEGTFNEDMDEDITPVLNITICNTLLYDLFDSLWVDKIMNIIFDKFIICCLGLLLIAFIAWYSLISFLDVSLIDMTIKIGLFLMFIIVIYLILVLLTVNKHIAKTILRSFEFYFKVYHQLILHEISNKITRNECIVKQIFFFFLKLYAKLIGDG